MERGTLVNLKNLSYLALLILLSCRAGSDEDPPLSQLTTITVGSVAPTGYQVTTPFQLSVSALDGGEMKWDNGDLTASLDSQEIVEGQPLSLSLKIGYNYNFRLRGVISPAGSERQVPVDTKHCFKDSDRTAQTIFVENANQVIKIKTCREVPDASTPEINPQGEESQEEEVPSPPSEEKAEPDEGTASAAFCELGYVPQNEGAKLGSARVNAPAACLALCQGKAGCQGFAYWQMGTTQDPQNNCYLKGEGISPTNQNAKANGWKFYKKGASGQNCLNP